jgi:phosphatidylinositol-4,5-bisphosphate 3-kinase
MVAWCVQQLINETGQLMAGRKAIKLWSIEPKGSGKHKKRDLAPDFIFRATNRDNQSSNEPCVLLVEFDDFELPVVAPLTDKYRPPDPKVVGDTVTAKQAAQNPKEAKKFHDLSQKADCLEKLTPEDKELLWRMRHSLLKYPSALPKFLQSVNWSIPDMKFEAHRMLKSWEPPAKPEHMLELLDAKYPDYVVRKYAVDILKTLSDETLRMYLLQLTQCLKFEPYHDSPLSRFLIERAIANPFMIGHYFFWHLKAELHAPHHMERFAVLLEHYLSNAGRYAAELRKQNSAVVKLQKVAEMIVRLKRKGKSDEEATIEYRRELRRLNSDFFEPMGRFQIPFNPKLVATKLLIPKCRYMSSKMVPLWLVFANADTDSKDPLYIIFKSGDDLRQDILTLQLLKVMDSMWLAAGLDLKMTPYEVIATGVNDHGDGVGMIQVVTSSDTTSGIQLKYGGGAVGALKIDPIDQFIRTHNEGKARYKQAVDIFTASCAGYCVATYVLGIGDRHNGNIMVKKDGHLFHIDFGHFLGNFKKKFGVNRERAAFVFTPEMAYVIGGEKYRKSDKFKEFLELSSESYKVLRENASFLECLFALMVAAGMPELMREDDIEYMREKLALNMHPKQADKRLHAEIRKSLDTTYRRIDNMIHNLRHG